MDLVIDHSVQVDYYGSETAYELNMEMEFKRNEQRYCFLNGELRRSAASASFRSV